MTSLAPWLSCRRFIASLGAALPAFAWAAYPDRPTRLICAFPPRSGSDFVARPRAEEHLKIFDRTDTPWIAAKTVRIYAKLDPR